MIDKEGRTTHFLRLQTNRGTVPGFEVKKGQGEMYTYTFCIPLPPKISLPSFAFRSMLHFKTKQENLKNSVFKNFLSAKLLSGDMVLIGASGFNNPLALSAAMRVASAGLNLCHTGGDRLKRCASLGVFL